MTRYVKTTADVRNLVIDLYELGQRASGLTCAGCGITVFGTAEELARLEHRPRCTFRRAERYLAATEGISESPDPAPAEPRPTSTPAGPVQGLLFADV
jgi:hypothetical protein